MKTFVCRCGAGLFFGNTVCTACGTSVGWCDGCTQMASLDADGEGFVCANPSCGRALRRCGNFEAYQVCTCCVPVEGGTSVTPADAPGPAPSYAPAKAPVGPLCRSCRLTETIPDAAIAQNLDRWRKLEAAKRRLLYELDELGLAYDEAGGAVQSVRFQFKADTPDEQVLTGHADGVVTINLVEADSVHREVVRQQFGEPQRTLIGHMRHEIGHYYWMTLVDGRRDAEFAEVFGDAAAPPYAEALARYYAEGPPADWSLNYLSAYAAAHPWEDFAETFAFYLDMRAILATVHHHLPQQQADPQTRSLEELIADYSRVGIVANEINRVMGLIDLLPEIVVPTVVPKIAFIHALIVEQSSRAVANPDAAAA